MADIYEIKVDLNLPYFYERVLALFGKDTLTKDLEERVQKQIRLAFEDASTVQCVGMAHPIRIIDIYQPTRFRPPYGARNAPESFFRLLQNRKDAVIFGEPGQGKTTLLHWVYIKLSKSNSHIPILFTLRRESQVVDLEAIVKAMWSGRTPKQLKK